MRKLRRPAIRYPYLTLILLTAFLFPWSALAQDSVIDREAYLAAAREIMVSARYCALITLDATGQPHVRTMDPFEPEDGLVVWMGTNAHSRKVAQIKNDSRVTLYYADAGENGYVAITGIAWIVDDPVEKSRHWKESWEAFYMDRETGYTLIRVDPETIEVLSLRKGLTGDPITWRLPVVEVDDE